MTDTIKPEAGKTYLTRDGRKARCICTNMRDDKHPVVCLVESDGEESAQTFTVGGCFYSDGTVGAYDLVSEVPRVVTVDVWAEITPEGGVILFSPTRFDPAHASNTIVKITQDVELPNV